MTASQLPRREPTQARGLRRWIYIGLGWVFVALGTAGAFLPVLPTTPFLILSAALFARSSPRFHAALLRSRVLGPYLRQWQADHSIPADAKRKAYAVIVLTFGVSIYVVELAWARAMLALLAAGLVTFLARLKTTERIVSVGEQVGGSVGEQDLERR